MPSAPIDRRPRLLLALGLLALLLASAAFAQDDAGDASATPEADAARVTVPPLPPYDPLAVTPVELKLRLRHLRQAELAEEVEVWLARLREVGERIAAVEIAAREGEGEEQAGLIELSTELKEVRAAFVERAEVAIDLLGSRGADVTEPRGYVTAVAGGLVDDLAGLDAGGATALTTAWNTLVTWGKSKEGGQKVLKNVGMFLVILVLSWILARILARLTSSSLRRFAEPSELLRSFLVNMVRRVVLVIGLVVAVSKLGVNIGPLVAAIGAAGLVIGFALQGTLSNFASGILILLYRPFDVGDAVEVAGVTGKVEAMSMVSTSITTFDNQLLVVPNNSVWNNIIRNVTGKPTRRVDMVFGIGYADDIERARSILERIVTGHALVAADPAPVIRLHELADSSVNFIVRPWARTEDYWDVYWDITREVKERFDAEGISIPFPQQDVHVHQASGAK